VTTYTTTGNGKIIRLGAVLGKGGEGTVHSVENDRSLAAKIYFPAKASDRGEKITKMVQAKLCSSFVDVAFPIDTLCDQHGKFSGFTMPRIGGRKPAHHLYTPTSRKLEFPKATYPMLVRTAANVARAFVNVHASGCIVGDVNHSGVLVSKDATVTLIDCDSFQFSYCGRFYYCGVGVPEFTPPELQGKSLTRIHRTANHDNFGLAVLIFYILMMGRHPFAGRYLGPTNPPLEIAIAEFRFAYSARRKETRMDPPPNVATLADLPLALRDAFEHAFGPSGASGQRPTATEWACILDRVEGEIVCCKSSPVHHYFRSAKSCPWCRMEWTGPLGADSDQAADLTVGRVLRSSNCCGLR
jgi:DNA-binding helix-hairpin-helix protein with protein kinase domain